MTTEHAEPQFISLEGPSMPQRLLKPLIAYLTPSDPPSFIVVFWQFIWSLFMAWISSRSPAEIILGLAMFFDYLSGYYAAEKRKEWDREKGVDGLKRKALLAAGALLLGYAAKIAGGGDSVVMFLDYCLVFNECRSIIKNLKKGDFEGLEPFEAVLNKADEQLRRSAGVGGNKDQKGE